MDFLLFIFILVIFLSTISSSSLVSTAIPSSVYPNSTASGTFLFSPNGKFKAAMFSPGEQRTRFYCSVIHVESNTVIWSANRDSPVSESGRVVLTANGITLIDADGRSKWSTPRFQSFKLVFALHLTDTGNLVLLDRSNTTLWESFRNPTDTIVTGQTLHLSTALLSAASVDDLSTGDYKLALTSSDVALDWKGLVYWKLSMDTKAYVNSNDAVEFLVVNQTGLYLFGQNGSTVVISVSLLPPSDFRFAKIEYSGRFIVGGGAAGRRLDLSGPVDQCHVPSTCGKLGLCNCGVSKETFVCSCPMGFRLASDNTTNCVPENGSLMSSVSCDSNLSSSPTTASYTYLQLSYDVDYFANNFNPPVEFGVNLSWCEDLCSRDCACPGIFYENSSGSCYKLENELGSVMSRTTSNGRLGFIKTTAVRPTTNQLLGVYNNDNDDNVSNFPGAKVVLPSIGVLFVFVIGILLWRRLRMNKMRKSSTNTDNNGKMTIRSFSSSCDDDDLKISVPGLPLRFSYEELVIATTNFKTEIGTGGYGTVYKGFMSDKTIVAVKRLTKSGHQGKKDFCAEIAAIGNIHHVNLVKLRGYCAEREEWLLVYEYMSHGSLDKTLFGGKEGGGPPVLEWQERVEIAIGTARGLAYLHGGCEPKVIHCDVKPENILLGGGGRNVKISDFGLSKFLGLGESSVMATMRGTRGYLAPEWLTRSTISDKTDVYSFGMVLFEMVSGRKNCLPSAAEEIMFFPLHALEMHERGRYLELVDPRLRGRGVKGEDVERMVRVALCCVHQEPRLRPSMVSVVGMLEGGVALDEPRVESLTFLGFYGRGRRLPRAEEEEDLAANIINVASNNNSNSSESVVSFAGFSNVSSQQISGPR